MISSFNVCLYVIFGLMGIFITGSEFTYCRALLICQSLEFGRIYVTLQMPFDFITLHYYM